MCHTVVPCLSCDEWLDEFTAIDHECKITRPILETPIEVLAIG